MNTPPTSIPRENAEQDLAEAFVQLADTLVDDYDVIELLHQLSANCVRLLPVDAAGLLLSDQRGTLQVVAASTESTHLLELFQLQAQEGPCLDCFHTSAPVGVSDLREDDTWPRFAAQASEVGFRSVYALPLRLRRETIGTLNLFAKQPTALPASQLRVGQALADVATIGILQERAIRRREIVAEQLEGALQSRVVIEQAKGILSERGRLNLNQAFDLMRRHARAHNQRLSELARAVTERSVTIDGVPYSASDQPL
jgi:transcriptional regulator with GAF, ATPase, and Fis domain